jgi:uncharacterized protein YdeI (YjbR/CyaY-like superfamily)
MQALGVTVFCMRPKFFRSPAALRRWLLEHHATAAELVVGFYKRDSGRPSPTWAQAVEEALCFGWIDGVRHRRDEESYTVRFTPRRAGSTWSRVNVARIAALTPRGAHARSRGACLRHAPRCALQAILLRAAAG